MSPTGSICMRLRHQPKGGTKALCSQQNLPPTTLRNALFLCVPSYPVQKYNCWRTKDKEKERERLKYIPRNATKSKLPSHSPSLLLRHISPSYALLLVNSEYSGWAVCSDLRETAWARPDFRESSERPADIKANRLGSPSVIVSAVPRPKHSHSSKCL